MAKWPDAMSEFPGTLNKYPVGADVYPTSSMAAYPNAVGPLDPLSVMASKQYLSSFSSVAGIP